jgi:hypothetical protein
MSGYLEFGAKLVRRSILVCLDEIPNNSLTTSELFIWISRELQWATRDMVETHGQWLKEQGYVTGEDAGLQGERLHLTDRGRDIAQRRVRVPGVARSATEA